MIVTQHKTPGPEAFRGFVEGVQNLQEYLRTNASARLEDAEEQFNDSLAADPDFAPSQYYKAIALTHARRAEEAIQILKGINQDDFKTEVLYNLAFAYTKTYTYENVELALEAITDSETLAIEEHRVDLRLLASALKAFVESVFGAFEFKHPDNFVIRQKKYLPEAMTLAESILSDPELEKLASETRLAVRVEANGAAGIASMYMGLYSANFEESTDDYWKRAQLYYEAALRLHPRNVRVLDDVATLRLMQAARATEENHLDEAKSFAKSARDTELQALSYHRHDRFRFYLLTYIYMLLGKWDDAGKAADHILKEPGFHFTEEQLKELKGLIHSRNIRPILDRYSPKQA